MPRQAARLVLGRNAKARLASEAAASPTSTSSRLQSFSTTTPRHWDDDANNSNNGERTPRPTSRVRSTAAASALGALSNGGDSSRGGRPTTLTRPNVISLNSLPRRPDGAPRTLIRKTADADRPAPGSAGFVPRFAGRSGGGGGSSYEGGGRFAGGVQGSRFGDRDGRGGGGYRGGSQVQGRGGFGDRGRGRGGMTRGRGRGGGGFRGRGGGRGRGRGRGGGRGGKRDGEREEGEEEEEEEFGFEAIKNMLTKTEALKQYQDELEKGVVRDYTPSTTRESLFGWGPAVATNTAIGQAETALRAMRIMGGGRAYAELEQSFNLTDEYRWRTAGKPVMYSRLEQKEASVTMMNPQWAENKAQKRVDGVIEWMKRKHGTNYSAFVEDYQKRGGEAGIRDEAEELSESIREHHLKKTKNESTRVAIANYAVKGDHPKVEHAEDKWGKLARYHASNPGYRPADAAKFDEKVRSVIRT